MLHVCSTPTQRMLKFQTLSSLTGWDVELVKDEEWGRVLVAQRDYSPGEVIIRSGRVLRGRSAADFVRDWLVCAEKAESTVLDIVAAGITYVTSSPRWAIAYFNQTD
jgi:hypothetical protein